MKVVISVCTLAAAVLTVAGAPALSNVFIPEPSGIYFSGPQLPYLRDRRSAYGGGYGCGAALPLGPAYGGMHGGYGGYSAGAGHAAYGGGHLAYGGVPSYGYGGPHYRADEGSETEILNFSDMDTETSEHMPMARYGGYGASAGHLNLGGYGGQLAPAVPSGPAFGVFPNANVGGCNVPLLLSCSPSIVPGRLVKSGGYGGAGYGSGAVVAAGANAYRGVDEQSHQDLHEEHSHEFTAHDSTEQASESTHAETHQ